MPRRSPFSSRRGPRRCRSRTTRSTASSLTARRISSLTRTHGPPRPRASLKPGGVFALADQSPPDGWEDWHNELERWRDHTHEQARSPREWRAIAEGAGFTVRDVDVVYQSHDVTDWLDRVDCPPDRRERALQMLRDIPREISDVYRPHTYEGRLHMRTPQCVLVATL